MNDPAVKTALAISLLVGGLFIAIVFRPVFCMPPGPMPQTSMPLSLQKPGAADLAQGSKEQGPISALRQQRTSEAAEAAGQGPTVLSPLAPPQPVPNLPPRYPAPAHADNARWGMPGNMMPTVVRNVERPKVHKIVDGDTLANLAAKYFGTENRATELFDANRDVLTDPDLLPIGAELKIPGR